MKLKKVLGLVVGAALAAAMSVSALAATSIGKHTGAGGMEDNQWTWGFNVDGEPVTGVEWATLAEADYLVFTTVDKPDGGFNLVLQSNGNGWAWAGTDLADDQIQITDTHVIINLKAVPKWVEGLTDATAGKFTLCYYNVALDEVIENGGEFMSAAEVSALAPAAAPAPAATPEKANPGTGDSALLMVFGEIMAIAALGFGIALVARRVKR